MNIFSNSNCLNIDADDIKSLIQNRNVCYADVIEVDGTDKIEGAFSSPDISISGKELKGLLIISGNITLGDTENIHDSLENAFGENVEYLLGILDDNTLGNDKIRITIILLTDN